jgi:hypothetical protein
MTAVVFKFTLPTGEPLVDAEFTVSLRKPGMFFDDAPQGIAVPDDVIGRTDAEGKCTLELLPLELSYYLTLQLGGSTGNEDGCTSGFRFRFRVPESTAPVDIVDLVVTDPTWSQAWDEKALGVIIDARVAAVAAAGTATQAAAATAADRVAVAADTAASAQHEINTLNARDAAEAYAVNAATSAQQTEADRLQTAMYAADAAAAEMFKNAAEEAALLAQNSATTATDRADAAVNAATMTEEDRAEVAANAAAVQAAKLEIEAKTWRFISPSMNNPTMRDNGNPLEEGDTYFNTMVHKGFTYNGTQWVLSEADLSLLENSQTGANHVGYDGSTVGEFLGKTKSFENYAELRAYAGVAIAGRILDHDTGGLIRVVSSTEPDNGIDIWVDASGRRWARQYSGSVDIRWAGAKDGMAYDITEALQACCTLQASRGGGGVYIPNKLYRKSDLTPSVKTGNYVTIHGIGEASNIFFDDRPENTVRQDVIDVGGTIGVTLSGFRISGTLKTYPTETGQKNCIVGINVRNFRMVNVTQENLRFMATNFHYVRSGLIEGCILRDIMRDGWRLTHSQDVRIMHNEAKRVADDVVACHMQDAATAPLGQGLVIANNTFETCQGMKVLGARMANITGNIMRRTTRMPLVISNTYDAEGNDAIFAINILGNQFVDTFNNYRSTVADCVISMVFRPTSSGPLAAPTRPGVNSSTFPYNYANNVDDGNSVILGAYGVTIADNKIMRTIDANGQAYSTLGFGNVLDRKGGSADEGFFDPIMTPGFFDTHGIRIYGPIRGLNIHHNHFIGGGVDKSAIILDGNASSMVADSILVDNNTFFDWPGIGVDLLRTAWASRYVKIRGNQFNMDPLFRHPKHAADNTWTEVPAIGAAGCMPIRAGNAGTAGYADDNEFQHCVQICDSPTRLTWGSSNMVVWQPGGSGTGLNDEPLNKGVRAISTAIELIHVIYNGDPASPTFTNIASTPRRAANAVPTTGTYIYGHFCRNTAPAITGTAGSRYIVFGWVRLTTGSAHNLNTDWAEVRTLTGT